MVDYNSLRKKFPSGPKAKGKAERAARIKAIANEYERKKAALGANLPLAKRGFPYYMVILIGLMLVGGLVIPQILSRGGGGMTRAEKDLVNVRKDLHALAVALGRFRYHTGVYPTTEQGLEMLALKRLTPKAPVDGWNGPYIKRLKEDPWGTAYAYANDGEGQVPTLYSCGPDRAAGTTDDIIASPEDFDEPFKDTSWTNGWVPQHLRGYVVAQSESHKARLEAELEELRHPESAPARPSVTCTVLEATDERAVVRAVCPKDGAAVTNDVEISAPILWTPALPYRHTLTVDGCAIHVPLRQYATNGVFTLNGKPFALKGVRVDAARGPLVASYDHEASRHLLETIKDLGANAVCVTGVGLDEMPHDFGVLCDTIGLILMGRADCSVADANGFVSLYASAEKPEDGLCDQAGVPTERFYRLRAKWNDRATTIRLEPHWNWRGREGEPIAVTCLTSGDTVELFLNGDSLGKLKKADSNADLTWQVPYEPGTLKAIAYKNDTYLGEASVQTAAKPEAVRLVSERTHLAEGELAYVTVDTIDAFDAFCPLAKDEVSFTLEGPGEIVAVGNGSTLLTEAGTTCALAEGRAVVVVRRTKGSGKPVELKASIKGLRPAQIQFLKR